MRHGPPRTFGKRNAPRAAAATHPPAPDPHQAFFAAVRAEAGAAAGGLADEVAPRAVSSFPRSSVPRSSVPRSSVPRSSVPRFSVPRSWRAGLLAGLVVACALAGLDATRALAAMRHLSETTAGQADLRVLGPALILLAVLGGGRSAATSLLLAHLVLAGFGRTEFWAYALAGAVAGAAVAALLAAVGLPVHHGLVVEAAAGGLGGFFYRVFAGTRAA